MKQVIHIFGASGSGTSTLGRYISSKLGYFFMDTDDYFWEPTDPPYIKKRNLATRLKLMREDIERYDNIVISGSLVDWGDELIPLFTLAIRVETDTNIRLERLKAREREKFGSRIDIGGDMYDQHVEFINWAASYDDGGTDMRSKMKHDDWQKQLICPLISVDGSMPIIKIFELIKRKVEFTMADTLSREEALSLLRKYNKEAFHIRHALTVEGVMKWYASELGFADEAEHWGIVGLLHDIDFEMYPEEHCQKAPELLRAGGAGEDIIHSVCSHGYGICSDAEPVHQMEKVLFAADELTGLIWAAALMRPSKSVMDMEVSSVKKKFKDKRFAQGCSRDIIKQGAEMLGWELPELFEKTILAMRSCEESVTNEMKALGLE